MGIRKLGDNYRYFWLGQGLTGFGESITAVALPLVAIANLDPSPFEPSVLVALETVPWVVLGLPTGVWVERWNKRRVLAFCGVVRALVLASIPVMWLVGSLSFWLLFGATLAAGTAGVFSQTASMAIVPLLVRRNDLVTANSRLSTVGSLASIIGESLGGAIVAAIGAAMSFAIVSLTCTSQQRAHTT